MSTLREIHTLAALDVSPQNIPKVGIPTFHDLSCNRSHREKTVCNGCRYNTCQGCGTTMTIWRYGGWTWFCQDCKDHSSCTLPEVPEEWKEVYTPPAAVAAPAVVVVKPDPDDSILISSDEEPEAPKDTTFPSHWETPPSGDMREVKLFKLMDDTGEVLPKYAQEVLEVAEIMEKARIECQLISDPIPSPFGYAQDPPPFVIKQITRIQNFRQTRMHRIAVEEATHRNGKEAAQMEGIGFHGTSQSSAENIGMNGPHTTKVKNGAYGWGVYLALDNIAIPVVYAIRNRGAADGLTMVFGNTLVGKNSHTFAGQDHANTGDDTGGSGNKFIHVVFDDYHWNPEYIIKMELGSEQEREDQLEKFKALVRSLASSAPAPMQPAPTSPRLPAPVLLARVPPAPMQPVLAPIAPVLPAPMQPVLPPAPIAPVPAPAPMQPVLPPPPGVSIQVSVSVSGGATKKKKRRKAPRFTAKKPAAAAPATVFKPTPPSSDDSSSDSDKSDPPYRGGKK
jgi:hypothetical protein